MQRDGVHIAFHEDQRFFFGVLGEVETEDAEALFIDRRIGGVDVLGLAVVQHAAAEGHHVAAHVDDGHDDAAAEIVVIAGAIALDAALQQVRLKLFLIGIALFAQMVAQGVPAVRRIAEPEFGDGAL